MNFMENRLPDRGDFELKTKSRVGFSLVNEPYVLIRFCSVSIRIRRDRQFCSTDVYPEYLGLPKVEKKKQKDQIFNSGFLPTQE